MGIAWRPKELIDCPRLLDQIVKVLCVLTTRLTRIPRYIATALAYASLLLPSSSGMLDCLGKPAFAASLAMSVRASSTRLLNVVSVKSASQ